MEQRIAANKRRAVNLALAFGATVFVVFTLLFAILQAGWFAPVIGLVVAGTWVGVAWFRCDAAVLDLYDIEPADRTEHARLFNVTEGLCAAMGLPMPDLYLIDDPARNASAVGRDEHHASVVVTTGFLDVSNLVELEAMIALQLYRIKSAEVVPETFVVPTVGIFGVLGEVTDRWEWLSRIVSAPMPLVDKVVVALHSSRRELDTDIAAVEFTRYPPALAAGLEKMAGHSALAEVAPVTAHLWAAAPVSVTTHPSVARIHAPLPERIAVLQEL